MVALGGFLFGSAFGLYFRVWILFPASIAAIVCIAISGAASDVPMTVACSVVAVLALQAGYCFGLVCRYVIVSAFKKAIASAKRFHFDRA